MNNISYNQSDSDHYYMISCLKKSNSKVVFQPELSEMYDHSILPKELFDTYPVHTYIYHRFTGLTNHITCLNEFAGLIIPADRRVYKEALAMATEHVENRQGRRKSTLKLLIDCRICSQEQKSERILIRLSLRPREDYNQPAKVVFEMMSINGYANCHYEPFYLLYDNINAKAHKKYKKQFVSCAELSVMQLYFEGMSTRKIAERLFISKETVNKQRKKLMSRCKISHYHEAIIYLHVLGLLPCSISRNREVKPCL